MKEFHLSLYPVRPPPSPRWWDPGWRRTDSSLKVLCRAEPAIAERAGARDRARGPAAGYRERVTLPTTDTIVTYPAGDITCESRVIHVESLEDRLAVLLDRTAVHPVDAGWPDQGADRALLDAGDVEIEVLDAVVAAGGEPQGEFVPGAQEAPDRYDLTREDWDWIAAQPHAH